MKYLILFLLTLTACSEYKPGTCFKEADRPVFAKIESVTSTVDGIEIAYNYATTDDLTMGTSKRSKGEFGFLYEKSVGCENFDTAYDDVITYKNCKNLEDDYYELKIEIEYLEKQLNKGNHKK